MWKLIYEEKRNKSLQPFFFPLSLLLFLKEFYLSICQFAIFCILSAPSIHHELKKLKVAFGLSFICNITPYI